MLLGLPNAHLSLKDRVNARRLVDHVRHPGVPALVRCCCRHVLASLRTIPARSGNYKQSVLHVRGVLPALLTGRIHGPCSLPIGSLLRQQVNCLGRKSYACRRTRKLLCHVFVKLVSIFVRAYEGSGLGVACSPSASRLFPLLQKKHTDVLRSREAAVSGMCGGAERGRQRTAIWWPYSCNQRSIGVLIYVDGSEQYSP